MRGREVTRLLRRRLGWNRTPVEVLRMMRTDAHPVALFGSWADGCDVIASEPILTRSGAAGRPGAGSAEAATGRILAALRADLDVPTALAIAEEAGGDAARTLRSLLGLW